MVGSSRHQLSKWVLALLLAAPLGCDAGEVSEYDSRLDEEIDLDPKLEPADGYPGDGDISIYDGPNTQDEDCLIFEIVGSTAHGGAAPDGPEIMTFDETTIRSPEGEILCTRDGNALEGVRIRDGETGDGPVLYTVLGRNVYVGELDLTGLSKKEAKHYLADRLVLAFRGNHIFDSFPPSGQPTATATEHIMFASAMRKLVITALIEGECGSPGMP